MQLHREEKAIEERGAALFLVGIGSPEVICAFRDDTGVTTPIFADPTLDTYRALGMRRGLATYLSLGFIANAVRALRAGYRNVSVAGDANQHGGVLVVRPGGGIAYRYISKTAGDHPPVAEVIAAL